MFDLPVGSLSERRSYSDFRKFLIKDGYNMEQFSVYTRVTLGRDTLVAHIERLRNNLPVAGAVTVLTLTEKQYESRIVLLGKANLKTHANDYGDQMTLLL